MRMESVIFEHFIEGDDRMPWKKEILRTTVNGFFKLPTRNILKPGLNFIDVFPSSFYEHRSRKTKDSLQFLLRFSD